MSVDQLKTLFQKLGIRTVAIVDDAYLSHPTVADLKAIDGLKTLWAAIDASDDVLEFLGAEGLSLDAPEDINESNLAKLYEIGPRSEALKAILAGFDEIQVQKRGQLTALKDLLRELELVPLELPPTAPLKPDRLPDLIFLDYLLDPGGLESSLPLAKSVGENIRTSFAQQQKPFVVLMSTLSEIKPENRSLFRETAGIIGGMFHFIPKADLQNRGALVLKLALMVRSIEEGRKIQQFVEHYDGTIYEIAAEFQKKIRGLSLEDYAYIQKMSLQGEGQPLGDYVLWLFGMYFSHLLARGHPEGRKVLDELVFSHIPDALDPPSPDFVGLYQNVVSEAVSELGSHPRLSAPEHARLGENAPPDPHFGDLFIRDDGAVLMVATRESDLAYAPEPNSTRPFDADQPVLLIPGQLQEQKVASGEKISTEYIDFDGRNNRIVWHLKKFKTLPAGSLRSLTADRFVRRRRLRMPFCHGVQQALTTEIERIGFPVAPPMVRSARVDIYYRALEGGNRHFTGDKEAATVSFTTRHDVEEIQFRLAAIAAIVGQCTDAIAELEKLRDADHRRRAGFERDITDLQEFLGSMERQLCLTESFSLKPSGKYKVRDAPVEAVRNMTADQLQNWRFGQPIVVLVVEDEELDRG
jgi:hypothetical protein